MNSFRQSTLSRLQDENRLLREQVKAQEGIIKNLMEKLEIRESNIDMVSYAEEVRAAYDK